MLTATNEVTTSFENKVIQTADNLIKECSKIRVRYSWFRTSAKIDDETLSEMMGGETSEVIKDAVVAHKRLLKSDHKALKTAKQAFQAIKTYVSAMSIPLVLLKQYNSEEDNSSEVKKDIGVRLIQKKDMEEFDSRMKYLLEVLNTSIKNLQEAMPEIKKDDRERLNKMNKRLYNENDYPSDVTRLVSVNYSFEPIGVDADWEKLCPEIYERERGEARKKFTVIVENAAVEFAERFVGYVKQVVKQVGNRVRLNPKEDFELLNVIGPDEKVVTVNVQDAEVKTKLTHEDDTDNIPYGYVLCELRLQKGWFSKGRSTEAWMEKPMKEKDFYEKLRPYETSERRKLYDSTIENLKSELETFINIGSMLGPYHDIIKNSVSKVKNLLTEASSNLNASDISEQLRKGTYFRNKMKDVLEDVANSVQDKMTNAVQKRRKISAKLIGKVGQ